MPTTIERNKDKKTIGHCPRFKVILFNDDINDMGHVIETLKKVVSIDEESAYIIMMTAHTNGKALVITCVEEHAEFYYQGLINAGLTASIEQE